MKLFRNHIHRIWCTYFEPPKVGEIWIYPNLEQESDPDRSPFVPICPRGLALVLAVYKGWVRYKLFSGFLCEPCISECAISTFSMMYRRPNRAELRMHNSVSMNTALAEGE